MKAITTADQHVATTNVSMSIASIENTVVTSKSALDMLKVTNVLMLNVPPTWTVKLTLVHVTDVLQINAKNKSAARTNTAGKKSMPMVMLTPTLMPNMSVKKMIAYQSNVLTTITA